MTQHCPYSRLIYSLFDLPETDITLKLDYRDPFMEPQKAKPVPQKAPVIPEETEPPIPPSLEFKGVIRKGKTRYALITNGPSTDIMTRGEEVEGYKLVVVTEDSVVLFGRGHSHILKQQ